MNENMITVTSMCNSTIIIYEPELQLKKTWPKIGSRQIVDRDTLIRAFYEPSVEFLFKEGILTTDDKQFLKETGLMTEEDVPVVVQVSESFFNRMIKLMPFSEFKTELGKLTKTQISDLSEYAIEHYQDLKMDRIDILSKISGKNILKAIENYKSAQED